MSVLNACQRSLRLNIDAYTIPDDEGYEPDDPLPDLWDSVLRCEVNHGDAVYWRYEGSSGAVEEGMGPMGDDLYTGDGGWHVGTASALPGSEFGCVLDDCMVAVLATGGPGPTGDGYEPDDPNWRYDKFPLGVTWVALSDLVKDGDVVEIASSSSHFTY